MGANATIVCGVTLGRYSFIAAGSVVTGPSADYSLVAGVPGRHRGWMSRHGIPLTDPDSDRIFICPESGYRYQQKSRDRLVCLDIDEDAPLPAEKRVGRKKYSEFKRR